jgi:hypothetical protein
MRRSPSVLDIPVELVIGRRFAPTRWRGITPTSWYTANDAARHAGGARKCQSVTC